MARKRQNRRVRQNYGRTNVRRTLQPEGPMSFQISLLPSLIMVLTR